MDQRSLIFSLTSFHGIITELSKYIKQCLLYVTLFLCFIQIKSYVTLSLNRKLIWSEVHTGVRKVQNKTQYIKCETFGSLNLPYSAYTVNYKYI